MLNRDPVWNNPEIRHTIRATICIILVFILLIAGLWHASTVWLMNRLHDRDVAVIGIVASRHPEWKDEIAASFAKEPTAEERAVGLGAASRFGFDRQLPLSLNPVLERFDRWGLAMSGLLGLALLLVSMGLLLRAYRRLYRTIDSYALLAERLTDGEFHLKPERPAEGVFSRLAHQFEQMANRLELTVERLGQEKESMKELLSDISHQLKTPLASIKMFNELLLDGAHRDEDVRVPFLDKSALQIEKMEWLIRQLLTVARVEAGSVELRLRSAPLLPTLERAVEAVSAKRDSRSLRIDIRAEGFEAAGLVHDPDWLAEAIGNLLTNSIEHTPEGGNVEVELQDSAVLARVVIRDDGEGIAREDMPNIFKRFYRGRGGSSENGTGIGLAFAKAIVERHGGLIAVRSEPGKGTAMTLTFPKLLGLSSS